MAWIPHLMMRVWAMQGKDQSFEEKHLTAAVKQHCLSERDRDAAELMDYGDTGDLDELLVNLMSVHSSKDAYAAQWERLLTLDARVDYAKEHKDTRVVPVIMALWVLRTYL